MKNQLYNFFKKKNKNVLCIYFTAGYPNIDSTSIILKELQNVPVDLIEIGIPYSDPLSDGMTIQNSNKIALQNGMNISLLFSQIKKIRDLINKPIILMGYFNQFYKFGEIKFLKKCNEINISGLIFPDIPIDFFIKNYQVIFDKYSIPIIFLITPQTCISRIILISKITNGFIYIVSSNSVTGEVESFGKRQISFFKKINKLNIKKPKLIGFGINNKKSFDLACKYSNGGVIGSYFIEFLIKNDLHKNIKNFINQFI
ncbi:tryptophan synthase subunit alpha [Blattabacterium cuenoti]|uniref:tryptophan synthase subunit alpha n=1 Tax=Blattabacterium cuenoti TaxID=1653831 RepID=UPI00163BD38F|nr:tryptophan synthase subunit alpha [Blattabacterium cuenoti]